MTIIIICIIIIIIIIVIMITIMIIVILVIIVILIMITLGEAISPMKTGPTRPKAAEQKPVTPRPDKII